MPPAQEITIPSKMNFSKGREDDFKDDVPFDDF
jgi:hypothetical protein